MSTVQSPADIYWNWLTHGASAEIEYWQESHYSILIKWTMPMKNKKRYFFFKYEFWDFDCWPAWQLQFVCSIGKWELSQCALANGVFRPLVSWVTGLLIMSFKCAPVIFPNSFSRFIFSIWQMLFDLISNYIVKYGNAANCALSLTILHTNLGAEISVMRRAMQERTQCRLKERHKRWPHLTNCTVLLLICSDKSASGKMSVRPLVNLSFVLYL